MSSEKKPFKEWIKENENKWIIGGIITICFAILIPIAIFFFSKSSLSFDSFAKLGTVGDFLGGSTVGFLSLASILFLISTIVMQRKELGLQREELQMTREELAKANEQYRITNDTMLKQQFETTFFNMINMHNNLVKGLTLYGTTVNDKDVFINIYEAIENYYKKESLISCLKKMLFREQDSLAELGSDFINFYNKVNYGTSEIDSEYDVQTFVRLAKKHLNGSRNDEIMREKGDMAVFYVFKFNYEELENYLIRFNNDNFINRIQKQFLNDEEYKVNAIYIVDYNFKFPFHHYFESIISVIDFLEGSNINGDEKDNYFRIFFSNLTTYEKTIINLYTKYKVVEDFEVYFNKYNRYFEKDKKFYNSTLYPDL
ncbi:hypothetical protein B1B04_13155 [Lysinibacillus sp. KCTC 33748]|uniref:putative phage abortive infection protein n=1 Tax=unclassified Lysinibacillus TaxID=2636778 RepID=UPI0009A766D6|nr:MULTISPECIES: putative phage abortive infection protein [unclassified Lysinibacillus]OXS73227.1 hypothetical protein B1B04_13155 [Lysinibacillus sp. KCTC 33748]SKB82975.1 hypothetical protein SAMN06295926_10987 [Lysinibacillus sp. AC-3]